MLLSTPTVETGWQAQPFTLSDPDGKAYSLEDLFGESGLVVAFIHNHCIRVRAIIDRFVADARTAKRRRQCGAACVSWANTDEIAGQRLLARTPSARSPELTLPSPKTVVSHPLSGVALREIECDG